jgi:hypothetical protein
MADGTFVNSGSDIAQLKTSYAAWESPLANRWLSIQF